MTMVFFLIVSFFGGLIQTVSGFGNAIFVQMFYPYLLPSAAFGTAIAGMMSPFISGIGFIPVRKKLQIRVVIPILIAYFAANIAVMLLLANKPDAMLRRILGGAMLAMSIYFLFFAKRIAIRPTHIAGAICGMLGGVLGGLFSMSGPPLVLYYSAATEDKDVYMANIRFTFLIANIFSTILRIISGKVTWQTALYVLYALCVVIPAIFLGKKLIAKINVITLKRIIYIFMAISGIIMLIRG